MIECSPVPMFGELASFGPGRVGLAAGSQLQSQLAKRNHSLVHGAWLWTIAWLLHIALTALVARRLITLLVHIADLSDSHGYVTAQVTSWRTADAAWSRIHDLCIDFLLTRYDRDFRQFDSRPQIRPQNDEWMNGVEQWTVVTVFISKRDKSMRLNLRLRHTKLSSWNRRFVRLKTCPLFGHALLLACSHRDMLNSNEDFCLSASPSRGRGRSEGSVDPDSVTPEGPAERQNYLLAV
jgi:hypothetical protein